MTTPPAQRLVLDLLVSVFGPQPVTSIVRAAEILGIEPNATRVALTRLKARGLVDNPSRGYWEAGPRARPLHSHIESWRQLNQRAVSWDGASWMLVYTGNVGADHAQMRKREHALTFLGFAPFGPHLHLRPDNLLGGLHTTRTKLHDLGLEPDATLATASALSPQDQARAMACWDCDALNQGYLEGAAYLARARQEIAGMELEAGARHTYLVGAEIVRSLVNDPLLPAQMVDVYARAQLVELMRTFDNMGQDLWRQVLGA